MRVPEDAPRPQQHWPSSGFWILADLIDVEWRLTVVLICSCPVTYDVEQSCHVLCLCAIRLSSFMKCLCRSFARFLSRLSVFLLLSFKIFLCIFFFYLSSDMSFVNTISQSVADLLILLIISFTEQNF